jgi:catechol-2,3-dioxygenase
MTTAEFPTPALTTGHVGLNVSDLDRSSRFYREAFGFEVLAESHDASRRFVFLGVRARVILTLWQQSAGRFATARPGLHHLSFEVPSIAHVRAAEQRLQALGAPVYYEGIVPHADGEQSGGLFFEDPDGVRLEVYTATGAGERPAPVAGAPSCGFFS